MAAIRDGSFLHGQPSFKVSWFFRKSRSGESNAVNERLTRPQQRDQIDLINALNREKLGREMCLTDMARSVATVIVA
jgi:hypothetical protein